MKTGRQYIGEKCKLYTLTGIKDAEIQQSVFTQDARIASIECNFSMLVNWKTVERKMESDKTFYAC